MQMRVSVIHLLFLEGLVRVRHARYLRQPLSLRLQVNVYIRDWCRIPLQAIGASIFLMAVSCKRMH